MNNPFSRLKHYTVSGTDPQARAIEQQENHATECLAACLVFSSKIRNEFIRFLQDDAAKAVDSAAEMEVVTQQTIEGGYIDLVLRQTRNLIIAVEVKVKSAENCDQLRKYKTWLDKQEEEPHRFLFSLVRNEDATFHPEKYGAVRRTWWKLYKSFQMLGANGLCNVEASLIENFCDYLESEAIVSTYEIKDLLSYAAGLRARQGINSIFNQIRSRLEVDRFQTVPIVDRKDYWPQLRIQHARWKSIFGEGENRKIALWFCIPGIWKATQHMFYPTIEIWHEDDGNVWEVVRSKLPIWLDALKSQNFKWSVFRTWNDGQLESPPAEEITVEPRKIGAWRDADRIILSQSELPGEDALINVLVNRIKDYATIVDSLAS